MRQILFASGVRFYLSQRCFRKLLRAIAYPALRVLSRLRERPAPRRRLLRRARHGSAFRLRARLQRRRTDNASFPERLFEE
jgi:hypothetical protein